MATIEINEFLNATFRRILERDDIVLRPEDTAQDVVGWDSIAQVQIIIALERHYAIRLRSKEINRLRNVGDLADLVHTKLTDRA